MSHSILFWLFLGGSANRRRRWVALEEMNTDLPSIPSNSELLVKKGTIQQP
jgi:hypothetical protein